ncbi:hypothetical protein Vadar_029850 [Vaccinium darrowii]|uniref:Uncharacterized protein n=1 Tax=Vaccinium darrowii TaxID=229202 RepID=A0ACB7YRS2_9ERIC|nr:hypothetical protein Vadar_029850 [Vaccinium darrowii]
MFQATDGFASFNLIGEGRYGSIFQEYGMGGLLSTRGDMYSYGVLLLEMFTGKRPTNKMFTESINLHRFERMALPSQVMNDVDHHIVLEVEEERKQSDKRHYKSGGMLSFNPPNWSFMFF